MASGQAFGVSIGGRCGSVARGSGTAGGSAQPRSGGNSSSRSDQPRAADDQPPVTELGLGDLRLPGLRIVLDLHPRVLGDQVDQRPDRLALLDPDREFHPPSIERLEQLVVLKPGIGTDQDRAGRPGATRPGEQLINKPGVPALRVRLPFPVTDMEHLAGAATGRYRRVISQLLGVAVARTLLSDITAA